MSMFNADWFLEGGGGRKCDLDNRSFLSFPVPLFQLISLCAKQAIVGLHEDSF